MRSNNKPDKRCTCPDPELLFSLSEALGWSNYRDGDIPLCSVLMVFGP